MSEKPKRKLSTLVQLWRFIKPYKLRLTAAATALIITAGATLAVGQGLRLLIDLGFGVGTEDSLNTALQFIGTLTVIMAVGTFCRFYLVSWLGERVSSDIRQAVFDHIIYVHPSYFEENRSGEIMSRITTDTTLLQSIIGSSLSMALRSTLTMMGGLVMLVATNLKLALIVLSSVPLAMIPILIFGRRIRNLAKQSQDTIADVGTYAGEAIQHVKTVQSYTQEEYEKSAFKVEVENAFVVARRRITQRAFMIAIVILQVFGALCGMMWVGGMDVVNGVMSAGDLLAFVFYAILVASGVGTVAEVYGELQRAAGATERLLELMSIDYDITAPTSPTSSRNLKPELNFNQVNFCYPSRLDQPALSDFSLPIVEGKSLALVGPSGAGKSTVFELLQRFYDPQEGSITLGGADLRELAPHDLRQCLAVVPQQPTLFSADVYHNIRYGKPDATDEEVREAARKAHASEFIERLPQGYESYLGENGVRLSGGQKQRIAIARAVLKNPKILLLDEATSALDTESEYHVQQALEELMVGRTTVIIAHRLSTILHADCIAVMNQGRVVATGTHSELLQSCPLYSRLASLQFRDSEPEA